MKIRKYSHKYKEVITSKFVVRLEDKTEDLIKTTPSILISGAFKEESYLSLQEAKELEKALHIILMRTNPSLKALGGENG